MGNLCRKKWCTSIEALVLCACFLARVLAFLPVLVLSRLCARFLAWWLPQCFVFSSRPRSFCSRSLCFFFDGVLFVVGMQRNKVQFGMRWNVSICVFVSIFLVADANTIVNDPMYAFIFAAMQWACENDGRMPRALCSSLCGLVWVCPRREITPPHPLLFPSLVPSRRRG